MVPQRVGPDELSALVAAADAVVEAGDNSETRHAVNRASVAHRRPLVSGAAIRFADQISVFDPRDATSPCCACLFPEDAAIPEERCATMGVPAPLTGTIGAMQATEVMQLLIRGTSALTGRLLLHDASAAEWQEVRFPRNPACPFCGTPG